jgi:serine protease inhibitor
MVLAELHSRRCSTRSGIGADQAARDASALIDRLTSSGSATVEIANSLWAILPSTPMAPSDFAQYLDPWRFQQVVGALQPGLSGELRIPRFSLDFTASLLEPLRALGMGPALEPGADFSGIAPSCERDCFISDVTQKSRLEVDEKGTTAAAATRVAIALSRRVGAPFRMVVDRPFLAAIQDAETGTLLFLGVIADPSPGRYLRAYCLRSLRAAQRMGSK